MIVTGQSAKTTFVSVSIAVAYCQMSRRNLAEIRVLITGASSGIGAALAIELATRHARLVLNGRREEKLQEVADRIRAAGGQAVLAPGDVTDRTARSAALAAADREFGGLDILINNAGVSAWGIFDQAQEDRLRRIMETNFFALAELTREAVPYLQRGRAPLVVNVASILGHRGIPFQAEYCASKFAVRGLSEAIRPELRRLNIDLLVVSPGTTESEFFDHLLERAADLPWRRRRGVPASQVARQTARAMIRGRHEIIPSGQGRLLVWLNRLFPRLVDAWMQRYTV
ncbi:MAG TPA: SDR family NAD(P)-dependent oxidoreductase [Pirellulales bacterium]|nr:SDR family NAD(P)-dependent oxidoreductase [Pirellulales bacterium]